MNYKNKKILGVGAGSEEKLREAVLQGADYVELIPFSSREPLDVIKFIEWAKRQDSKTSVGLRKLTSFTLEDDRAFDYVFAGPIEELEFQVVSGNLLAAVRPCGELIWLKPDELSVARHQTDSVPVEPLPPLDPHGKRGSVLHVHNVQRCGGTGNFVFDMSTCFPEFHHSALCVNDANGDPSWINAVSSVMRPFYSPALTQEILEDIDPRIVVLHATAGRSLEGEWPYAWIQDGGRRYVIAVHHVGTYPLLRADLDVFVSEFIKDKYASILDRCKRRIVMPPCMNLDQLASIPIRLDDVELKITTAGKHCDELLKIAKNRGWDYSPPGRLGAMRQYLPRFNCAVIWSGHHETWCRTLTECMAAGLLVLGHNSGAIPEQIKHGETGFLFDNEKELEDLLDRIIPSMEKIEIGAIRHSARQWALENAGFDRMRRDLYPYITSALTA